MNTSGPFPAPVMIVGESWGKWENEDPQHSPFIGPSGWELNRILGEAGFSRNDCFCANVVNARPPGDKVELFFHNKTEGRKLGMPLYGLYPNEFVLKGVRDLENVVRQCQPKLIIALGNSALWALTQGRTRRPDEKGNAPSGILRWRGSELDKEDHGQPYMLLPTIHPAAVLREWAFRPIVVHDLRRAEKLLRQGSVLRPQWNFQVRPVFEQVVHFLNSVGEARAAGAAIAVDIETRGGQIACIGIATSLTDAICIPLMDMQRGSYWSVHDELAILYHLRSVLRPRGAPIIYQNGAYDLQYKAKQLGWLPAVTDDTMLMQHTLFPGMRKGLDFLSSMYCEYHRYWKDDGKNYDPVNYREDELWRYNCEDCVRTLEVWQELRHLIDAQGMRPQYEFQMRLFHHVLRGMLRGVRFDRQGQRSMAGRLETMQRQTEDWINRALGRDFNCRSNPQMTALFYEEMGCRPIKKRGKNGWNLTCDDEALHKLKGREPLLVPLLNKIQEFRSIGVFKKNYAEMPIPPDGRMRCTMNLAGTETFRFSASEDAFGFGGNLQTLPKGTEDE